MGDSDQLDPDDAHDLMCEFDAQMLDDFGAAYTCLQDGRFEDAISHYNGAEGLAERIVEIGEESGEESYIKYGEFTIESLDEIREAIREGDIEKADDILESMEGMGPSWFRTHGEDD